MRNLVAKFFAVIALVALTCLACKQSDKASFSGSGDVKESNTPPPPPPNAIRENFTGANREPYKVDLIFLLDTSPSMQRDCRDLIERFPKLINDYLLKVPNLDYQVFVYAEGMGL